jgi:hypothetical protein
MTSRIQRSREITSGSTRTNGLNNISLKQQIYEYCLSLQILLELAVKLGKHFCKRNHSHVLRQFRHVSDLIQLYMSHRLLPNFPHEQVNCSCG